MKSGRWEMGTGCPHEFDEPVTQQCRFTASETDFGCLAIHERQRLQDFVYDPAVFHGSRRLGAHEAVVIASLGDKADRYGVTRFIDVYLLTRGREPYGGLPPKEGPDWLKNLKADKKLIESVLGRMWIQNKKELSED